MTKSIKDHKIPMITLDVGADPLDLPPCTVGIVFKTIGDAKLFEGCKNSDLYELKRDLWTVYFSPAARDFIYVQLGRWADRIAGYKVLIFPQWDATEREFTYRF